MAFEDLLVSLVSKLDDKGFKELDKLETKANSKTDMLSRKLQGLFVGAIGTIGIKEIISASVKLDTLQKSMSALAGSEIGGIEQIEYLRRETQRLGQDFLTSADAYKNLFSAGLGTNMKPEEIQKIFTSVLEAGTVLGSSEQQMQGALMALEQMISKGKVSMEELRRQLGNALPGAMQIAARAMHTTSAGLQEMLKDGLDSKKFVSAFAEQLHYEFGEKAVKASHTLRAELARLKNALFNLETSFLDGEAGEAFAETIRQLVTVLQSSELQASLKGISQFLTFLLQNIKPIMAILGMFLANAAIGKAAKGIGSLLGMGKGSLKFAANLLKLTQGIKWLPRILQLLKLAWWALSPLKKVEIAIWLIWGAFGLITALLKKIAKIKEEKENEKNPHWQETEDGKYTDVNPKSPTYMQFGKSYSKGELGNIIKYGNKGDFEFKPDRYPKPSVMRSEYGGYETIHGTTKNFEISGTTININTKSDDPQSIGQAVKTALLDVLDSKNMDKGYLRTATA